MSAAVFFPIVSMLPDNPNNTPFLFDEEQMPVRPDVVELVKQGVHRHTGARLMQNEKLCQRMVELLMARWGVKRIAVELGVSKWSVKAAREALVARGEMAPWKERVVSLYSDIVEVGAEKYLAALEQDKITPDKIPINGAVTYDKRALAVGDPTSRVETSGPADSPRITTERLMGWVKGLPVTVDPVSTGTKLLPAKTWVESEPAGTLAGTATPETERGGGGLEGGTGGAEPTGCLERNTDTKETP